MKLSLIDSHCDTAFELYLRQQSIKTNSCHISLDGAQKFQSYAQFFAVWADKRRSDDDCYSDFLAIAENLKSEVEKNADISAFVTDADGMKQAFSQGRRAIFLAVEDARILGGDLSRLDVLHAMGVKYLTLLWGGATCIGASHDTKGGLTPFGRAVVSRCFELGILPDVSHANERVTDEVAELAHACHKPFIASHSNCFEQYAHTRNLRKRHLDSIIELGGIAGVSLCPYHLKDMTDGSPCSVNDVCDHIEKYLELGALDVLGLGCDLDGTSLPDGFDGISDLYKIADALSSRGLDDSIIEKIFCKNYYSFIEKNF